MVPLLPLLHPVQGGYRYPILPLDAAMGGLEGHRHLQFFNLLLYRSDLRLADGPGLLGGFQGVYNLAYLDSCSGSWMAVGHFTC